MAEAVVHLLVYSCQLPVPELLVCTLHYLNVIAQDKLTWRQINQVCVLQTELDSFLIQISAEILAFKDTDGSALVDKILDKTGMKGTGEPLLNIRNSTDRT